MVGAWNELLELAIRMRKAFAYQKEPKERFLGQSQDVLNLVFDGKNTFLPQKYNLGRLYNEVEQLIKK